MSGEVHIRVMQSADVVLLSGFAKGHVAEADYFFQSLEEQSDGKRVVFLAFCSGNLAGYVHYNRFPQYQPFRSLEFPEIQDLYVDPSVRRQGIARALITACEDLARQDGKSEIGIGVGIGKEFGPAQNLYGRCGYIPDGAGAVFERESVTSGDLKPVDERLCLMMVKVLA